MHGEEKGELETIPGAPDTGKETGEEILGKRLKGTHKICDY